MASSRPSAAHASVAFLRLLDFAQQPVAEQARLKSRLEEVVAASIRALRSEERIVLEGSEGIAVVVLANPRGALRFAWQALAQDRELPMAVGLTHGPVRVSGGVDTILHGDGLAAAEAISTFARDGAVAVSREFRDALSRTAPGAARHLPNSYTSVDAADRSFELVHADEGSFASRRRRFFALTAAACVAIVGLGGVARWTLPGPQPGTVVFDIKPAGDIYVNGTQKGSVPPLKSIQLPAGTHTIEIRHVGFPPLVTMLTIAPGEQVVVNHSFSRPKPPAPPAKPAKPAKPAWRRFLDKLTP